MEVHVADAVDPDRVHVVNVPVTPISVRDTVPVGVVKVPGLMSVTVTLHEDAWPTLTGDVHETVVVVARLLTVSEADAVPVPAVLVALTLTVKVLDAAYVCVSVVALPERLSVAVPSPHWTVTLVGELVVENVTVTAWPMTAGFGASVVIVTVGVTTACPTARVNVPLLPVCTLLPP